jgi:hypothetical protein
MHSTLYVTVIYRRTLDITRVESKLFDGERYLGSHCHVHPDSSPDDMSQCCAFLISPYLPLTDSASLHLVKYALHGTYSSHRCPHSESHTADAYLQRKSGTRSACWKLEAGVHRTSTALTKGPTTCSPTMLRSRCSSATPQYGTTGCPGQRTRCTRCRTRGPYITANISTRPAQQPRSV